MGVDVTIAVEGVREWDDEHHLSDDVARWLGMYREDRDAQGRESGPWSVTYHADLDLLELNCLTRYYGPGYERGPWGAIYAALRCLTAIYPGKKIRYGGDSSAIEYLDEATPELLEAIWAHYLGPEGDGYHRRIRGGR